MSVKISAKFDSYDVAEQCARDLKKQKGVRDVTFLGADYNPAGEDRDMAVASGWAELDPVTSGGYYTPFMSVFRVHGRPEVHEGSDGIYLTAECSENQASPVQTTILSHGGHFLTKG